ncbi:MAG: hypothetical protein ACRENP_26195 [Longimicrobiales bacterium]
MTWLRIGRLVVLTLLALSAYWGFTQGPREIATTATFAQKAVGIGQIVYALCGLLAILCLWFRPRWAKPVAVVWAAAVTLTAVLAALAWPASLGTAAVAVAIFAGLGWMVVWLIDQTSGTNASSPVK